MGLIYTRLARANERRLAGSCCGCHAPKTPAVDDQFSRVAAVGLSFYRCISPLGEPTLITKVAA